MWTLIWRGGGWGGGRVNGVTRLTQLLKIKVLSISYPISSATDISAYFRTAVHVWGYFTSLPEGSQVLAWWGFPSLQQLSITVINYVHILYIYLFGFAVLIRWKLWSECSISMTTIEGLTQFRKFPRPIKTNWTSLEPTHSGLQEVVIIVHISVW